MKSTLKIFEKHNRGISSLMAQKINESDPHDFDFVFTVDPKDEVFNQPIKNK